MEGLRLGLLRLFRWLVLHQLQVVDFLVQPALREQFVVAAALDDSPVGHDQDQVGAADGGESVRDHKRGASLHQAVERLLDEQFGLRVHAGGGVVQDQNARGHQQGAGDGDALALSARKRHAALAHHRLVAVREMRDEVVRLRGPRGGDDLRLARVGAAVGDVGADRVREQQRGLKHDPDLPAERSQVEGAHVAAVNQQRALGHVVEAGDEIHERGLARASLPDQRDELIRLHGQFDIRQRDGFFVLIFERDVAELDAAAQSGDDRRVFRRLDGGFRFEDLQRPLGARARLPRRVDQPRQLLDGGGQHQPEGVEGHDLADGHFARQHVLAAEDEDENRPQRDQQVGGGHHLRPLADQHDARFEVRLVDFLEAAGLVGFAREGAHHLHAADVFLQARGDVAEGQVHFVE
ncbi:MAG: hypothetical protein PGMFKBFP_02348 [Anaerolineales bacterium]|nr:hypothetical protein [Anaerolineales bacterium]